MDNSKICHLHLHSTMSTLDGLGTPEKLAVRASELGFKALGVTDHGNVDSAIKFYNEMKSVGIKPVIGSELYYVDDIYTKPEHEIRYHLTVLCKNNDGFHNLMRMLTIASSDGFYRRPRIDMKLLERYGKDLVIMTGCSGGIVAKGDTDLIIKLKDMYKEDFYLEIMPHNYQPQILVNDMCYKLSKTLNIPLVSTNDNHYIEEKHSSTQEVLLAMQRHAKWTDPKRWKFDFVGLYMRSLDEMIEAYDKIKSDIPKEVLLESLYRTMEISEKCNVILDKKKIELPLPPCIVDKDEDESLLELCLEGWGKRLDFDFDSEKGKEYYDRMTYELSTIKKLDFVRYFLIVWELIDWCRTKQDMYLGYGRGSSAGSLVCYFLGITSMDPIRYKLLFGRFISDARIDLPDIDMDFPDIQRVLVKRHLEDNYGKMNVANVSTFSHLHGKMAIRDVSRVFDIPIIDVNKCSEAIISRSTGDSRCMSGDTVIYTVDGPKIISLLVGKGRIRIAKLQDVQRMSTEAEAVFSGEKELFELETESGRKIKTSIEHKFWTENGWKEMKTLEMGKDLLYLVDESSVYDKCLMCGKIKNTRKEKIISIKSVGIYKSYDMIIFHSGRCHHGFLANGIQVHNSNMSIIDSCDVLEDAKKFKAKYPNIINHASVLEGEIRGKSLHAAGIVVSKEALDLGNHCVLQIQNGETVVNWDKHDLEQVGLMKLDVLGLNTLTMIQNCKKLIKKTHDIDIDLYKIEPDDPKVLAEFNKGETEGIFQFSSLGLSKFCKSIGISAFDDLVVLNSLHRPGGLRCLHRDSMISLENDRVRIEDLHDRYLKGDKIKVAVFGRDKRKYIKKVKAIYKSEDIKEFYEMMTSSDDSKLICSLEHNIFTSTGWKELKDIEIGDFILSYNEIEKDFMELEVKKIDYYGEDYAYDIEIDSDASEEHNYIANNIVVHNSGIIDDFDKCKKGLQKPVYYNSEHKRITEDTFGLIIYQEQIMQIMHDLANIPWRTADIIRKIVSKSQGVEAFAKFRQQFVDGCIKKNTLTKKQAEEMFQIMSASGSYSFNRSHSVCYSMLGYAGMLLKTYYPLEFILSLLNTTSSDKHIDYIRESRRLGIEVSNPNINLSEARWSTAEGKIISGFEGIKGVGVRSPGIIKECRDKVGGKWNDFDHFLETIDRKIVNRRVIDALIKAGAFDSMEKNNNILTAKMNGYKQEDFIFDAEEAKKIEDENKDKTKRKQKKFIFINRFTEEDRMIDYEDVLPFEVNSDPLYRYKSIISLLIDSLPIKSIAEGGTGTSEQVSYYIGKMTELKYGYRQNRNTEFVAGVKDNMGGVYGNLEDRSGYIMLVFKTEVYLKNKETVENLLGKFILVKGFCPARRSTLVANAIWTLDDIVNLTFDKDELDIKAIKEGNGGILDCTKCEDCRLRENALAPVMTQKGKMNIMVVGEASGTQEDKEGKPLVGAVGKVLFDTFSRLGLDREYMYITTCVRCKPFKNPGDNKTPAINYVDKCSTKWLDHEIRAIKPSVIFAPGNIPLYFFTGKNSGIIEKNASVEWNKKYGCWIVYSIHPAAVLYNRENQKMLDDSCGKFIELVGKLG